MEKDHAQRLVEAHTRPQRRALSTRYPLLKTPIGVLRRSAKKIDNRRSHTIARNKSSALLPCVIARHQSVLLRRLGDSDMRLQQGKITNLRRACADLHGLIIRPGETWSLWESIGKPTRRKGYVNGMLLSNGKVIEGIGGGLCQLSNFLCWLFMHADTAIVERYHHSMDVFPDSGRVLPFGSGATCLYNTIDLKIRNTGSHPLQLSLRVTDRHLKGQLLSSAPADVKYSVAEADHCFIKSGETYYRYNTIWKIGKRKGKEISHERMFENFAPVLYPVTAEYLENHRCIVLK